MFHKLKNHLQPGIIWLSFLPSMVLAQTDNYGLEGTAEGAGLKEKGAEAIPLPVLIGNLIKGALSLLGVIFFILILYGGFKWMKAKGNDKEVTDAKEVIVNATIGLVIIGAAYTITTFVFQALTK